jgi:site-specific DNA recombinase
MATPLFPGRVGLYARVSDPQADGTIASQVDTMRQRAAADGCPVEEALVFCDDGHSGSTLFRPALERLRDQAAAGALDRLYVLNPDRLARHYAYQFLLVQELEDAGVDLVFLNRPLGQSPEDNLLLQVQGMIAEFERAKITERCRRGKVHAARRGDVAVLSRAPYGYRYVTKQEGSGHARYEILLEEARIVQQIFTWVGQERLSLAAVCRRLQAQGVPSPSGQACWRPTTLGTLLKNPAYQGQATYGKRHWVEWRPPLRPRRGQPTVPRRPGSVVTTTAAERLPIPVPALVSPELFAAVAEQLAENRRRQRARRAGARHLLQGLLVCSRCGDALHGRAHRYVTVAGVERRSVQYRCGGRQVQDETGQAVCVLATVPATALDDAVWADVCRLLDDPDRIAAEYERRQREAAEPAPGASAALGRQVERSKKTIARLIDSYTDGLLERSEFEPRLRAARERLARLEEQARQARDDAAQRAALRLVVAHVEEFAAKVKAGLGEADWATRREIIRALVRQIEVGEEEIRMVYRMAPVPFAERPNRGFGQDCTRRCIAMTCNDATTRSLRHRPTSLGVRKKRGMSRRPRTRRS